MVIIRACFERVPISRLVITFRIASIQFLLTETRFFFICIFFRTPGAGILIEIISIAHFIRSLLFDADPRIYDTENDVRYQCTENGQESIEQDEHIRYTEIAC